MANRVSRRWFAATAGLLLAGLVGRASWAAGSEVDPAAAQIQKFYNALIAVMKKGPALGIEGRYRALKPAVEAAFDLPTMTELSVGPEWADIAESNKKALINAFERMTIANYAKNFASYDGEKFEVQPTAQERSGDKLVQSRLIGADKKVTPFNYRMRKSDDTWKIIDVFLNGYVSQLAVRRSEFAATVATSGASGLIKKINDLSDELMAGG